MDILWEEQKCPFSRGVRHVKVVENRNALRGHVKETCPSYGVSVLRVFTVMTQRNKTSIQWTPCSQIDRINQKKFSVKSDFREKKKHFNYA